MKIKYFLGDERRGRLDREERGGERREKLTVKSIRTSTTKNSFIVGFRE